jgi:hypothetical protein
VAAVAGRRLVSEDAGNCPKITKYGQMMISNTSSDAGTEMLQVVDSFPPSKQTIIWYATGKPRKIQEQWFEMV